MALPYAVRLIIGLCYGFYLLISITAGVFGTVVPMYLLVRPFSQANYLRWSGYIQDSFLTVFPLVLEVVLGIKTRWTGTMPKREPLFILANHLNEEWPIIYGLAYRTGTLGGVRCVMKKVLKWIPGFGWGMWILYWPFVARDQTDLPMLTKFSNDHQEARLPIQLWIYPEGTRQTPKKLKESQEYAKAQGYPVMKHIMLPRHRGFLTIARALQGFVRTILSITIQFEGWGKPGRYPSTLDFFSAPPDGKHVIHVHMQQYSMASLPADDEGRKQWLFDCFVEKDRVLEEFATKGRFPGPEIVTPVSAALILPHLIGWFFVTVAYYYAWYWLLFA